MARDFKDIEKQLKLFKLPEVLSDTDLQIQNICERSFYDFIKIAWPIIEGGTEFKDGWHIKALADHLEALYKLDISRLIINCPPRSGKSNILCVLFPAWLWVKDPSFRMIYSSYNRVLSTRHCTRSRKLILSDWYQKFWGHQVIMTPDSNTKLLYENMSGGFNMVTSTKSATTGHGGHFVIEDDPQSVDEAHSETARQNSIDFHTQTLSSRYAGDPAQFRRVVCQQRLHEKDLTGFLMSDENTDWVHLRLPMEFETANPCKTGVLIYNESINKIVPWKDPRKNEGELLWPSMIDKSKLKKIKEKNFKNDSYLIASQLQQRPSPAGGAIFLENYFPLYPAHLAMPSFEEIIQSWDTAFTGTSKSAYSACTTWGIFHHEGTKKCMLLSLYKERVEWADLKEMALRLYVNYFDTNRLKNPVNFATRRVDKVIIEKKASGYSLVQELSRMGINPYSFNPNKFGDKITRARRVTDICQNGKIVLLESSRDPGFANEYGKKLLHDITSFPYGESADVVDSMSQALIILKRDGVLIHDLDLKYVTEPDWKKNGILFKTSGRNLKNMPFKAV